MKHLMALIILLTTPALADPAPYVLDQAASEVRFTYTLDGNQVTGTIPLQSADIAIDFDTLSESVIDVTLDIAGINGGVIFATQALKAADMFHTAAHPSARFQAQTITGQVPKGTINGPLTIKGTTRPVTLTAEIFRQAGTDAGDLRKLTVALRGRMNRNDFGLTAYQSLVASEITLDIRARITQKTSE